MAPAQFWDVSSDGEIQSKQHQKRGDNHLEEKNISPDKNGKSDANAKKCGYQKPAKVGCVQ